MGKYAKRKKRYLKPIMVLVSVAAIVLSVTTGTLAYLNTVSGPIKNIFTSSRVACAVVEEFDGKIKRDVFIENTGDTEAYIRAAVVVTWQKNVLGKTSEVYAQAPVDDEDYKIVWYNEEGDDRNLWIKGSDGFFYYTEPVKPGEFTDTLIYEVGPDETRYPEDGYKLCVEILASAIQSVPTGVVIDAWSSGVSGVDGTTLQIKQ